MDRIIEVKVVGNYLSKDNKTAGVRGEANVAKLRITFDEGWNAYTKKITFWNARGLNPVVIVLLPHLAENENTYLVPIPAEPMEEAGMLTFVIEGTVDEKVQRSVLDKLEVKDAPITQNAGQPVPPADDELTQLEGEIEKIKSDILDAKNAKKDADAAKHYMDAADSHSKSAKLYRDEARQSAREAGDSASKAEEVVGKTPYIGYNGNWFAWDVEKKAFYDTGVRANGHSPILKKHEITAVPDVSGVGTYWGPEYYVYQDGKYFLTLLPQMENWIYFPIDIDASLLFGKTVKIDVKVEKQTDSISCWLCAKVGNDYQTMYHYETVNPNVQNGTDFSWTVEIGDFVPDSPLFTVGVCGYTPEIDNTIVLSDLIVTVVVDGDEEWYVWDDKQQTYVYSGVKAKGQDGYTPQRGTDYWTPEDKAEMEGELRPLIVNCSHDGGTGKWVATKTFAEIKEALNEKCVIMRMGSLFFSCVSNSDTKIVFSGCEANADNPIHNTVIIYEDDRIQVGEVQAETTLNKVWEITDNVSDEHYPTALAVKEYIDKTLLGGAW